MQAIETTIERLSGRKTEVFVHAPFTHPANITPYRHLRPALPYDLAQIAGKAAVLFATQDKTETLGLWAAALKQAPGSLTIVWPNDMGGRSLAKFCEALGLRAQIESKHHAKIAFLADLPAAKAEVMAEWSEAAAAKPVTGTTLIAEAGLFSHRHADPASALLAAHIPDDLSGHVADFGCGYGYLSQVALRSDKIEIMHVIDNDTRAVNRARANLGDKRVQSLWVDIATDPLPGKLDAVIMNPPFHINGVESKALGLAFIEQAAKALKKHGTLYLVANRHLPYEAAITRLFAKQVMAADTQGFKVIIATKGQ